MKKTLLLLLLFITTQFLYAEVKWPTPIPNSKEERIQQIEKLSDQSDIDTNANAARQLALTYGVFASLDEKTKENTKKGITYFKRALKLAPDDVELMAYQGSLETTKSLYTEKLALKTLYAKKGFILMDKAIAKDNKHLGALLARAKNSFNVPMILERLHYAEKDYNQILQIITSEKVAKERSTDDFTAQILFDLGMVYEKMEEDDKAKEFFSRAKKLDAGFWSKKAGNKL